MFFTRTFYITCLLAASLLGVNQSFAETDADLIRELRALKSAVEGLSSKVGAQQERIAALESENRNLVARNASGVVASGSAVTSAPVSVSSSPRRSSQFNPDVGFVVDIVSKLTQDSEDAEGNDRVSVRHAEVILGHDIDPYSRLDATLAFSDTHGVELEEAYVTHWGLPWEFKGRLGRFHPKVGVAGALHTELLDSVDTPLFVSQYLGEEGFIKTGVELSNFIPLPWEDPSAEVIVGLVEGGSGEEGQIFGDTLRRPTYYARLRGASELSDVSSLEIGGTFLLGSADEDSKNEVRAFGTDVTFIHSFNAINRLKLQAEALFQDRSEGYSEPAEEEAHGHALVRDEEGSEAAPFRETPWGMYFLADYRLSQRYGVGARFDLVEPINKVEGGDRSNDIAYNAIFTFHQSEFARWRVQYQYLDRAEEGRDNRFFLQGTFAIGVHKHQLN